MQGEIDQPLVIGAGSDLCEHGAHTHIAVRSPVNIVRRDVLGIPAQTISIAERGLPPRVVDAVNGLIVRPIKPDVSAFGIRRAAMGPSTQIAELYFCGFKTTATGALREAGIEARRIARALGPARGSDAA